MHLCLCSSRDISIQNQNNESRSCAGILSHLAVIAALVWMIDHQAITLGTFDIHTKQFHFPDARRVQRAQPLCSALHSMTPDFPVSVVLSPKLQLPHKIFASFCRMKQWFSASACVLQSRVWDKMMWIAPRSFPFLEIW